MAEGSQQCKDQDKQFQTRPKVSIITVNHKILNKTYDKVKILGTSRQPVTNLSKLVQKKTILNIKKYNIRNPEINVLARRYKILKILQK